jgi:branched-chain amino acid transport system permease protein
MLAQVILSGFLLGGTYALMAVGLSLTLGVMHIINLAHGLFYTLGSFIIYTLVVQPKVNSFLALILTFIVVFLVGLIIERILIRPIRDSHLNVMIATFALAIFGEQCIHLGWGVKYLSAPPFIKGEFQIGQVILDYQRLLSFAIGMALVAILAIVLKKTKLGKATRMVQQDREMAMVLLAPLYLIFPAMGWNPLLISFAIVILGGMGSIGGTVIGGILFGLITLLTSYFISSGMVNVVPFLAIIATLLIRPSGFFGKSIF